MNKVWLKITYKTFISSTYLSNSQVMKAACFGKTKFGTTVASSRITTDFESTLEGESALVSERKPSIKVNSGKDNWQIWNSGKLRAGGSFTSVKVTYHFYNSAHGLHECPEKHDPGHIGHQEHSGYENLKKNWTHCIKNQAKSVGVTCIYAITLI